MLLCLKSRPKPELRLTARAHKHSFEVLIYHFLGKKYFWIIQIHIARDDVWAHGRSHKTFVLLKGQDSFGYKKPVSNLNNVLSTRAWGFLLMLTKHPWCQLVELFTLNRQVTMAETWKFQVPASCFRFLGVHYL